MNFLFASSNRFTVRFVTPGKRLIECILLLPLLRWRSPAFNSTSWQAKPGWSLPCGALPAWAWRCWSEPPGGVSTGQTPVYHSPPPPQMKKHKYLSRCLHVFLKYIYVDIYEPHFHEWILNLYSFTGFYIYSSPLWSCYFLCCFFREDTQSLMLPLQPSQGSWHRRPISARSEIVISCIPMLFSYSLERLTCDCCMCCRGFMSLAVALSPASLRGIMCPGSIHDQLLGRLHLHCHAGNM